MGSGSQIPLFMNTLHTLYSHKCVYITANSCQPFFFFEWGGMGWEIGVGIFLSSKCKNINEKSIRIGETATFFNGTLKTKGSFSISNVSVEYLKKKKYNCKKMFKKKKKRENKSWKMLKCGM